MTNPGQALRTLIALSAALSMAACTAGEPTAAPTTTASAPTTTTTTVQTLAQKQAAEAEDAVVAFWSVVDKLSRGEIKSLTKLSTVARARALDQWREVLLDRRRKGWRKVGETAVQVTDVKPVASGRYSVTVCLNFEGTDFVDKDGQSVLPKGSRPHDEDQYTVELTDAGGFVVDQRIDRKAIPC
jgi:hypothetical protein